MIIPTSTRGELMPHWDSGAPVKIRPPGYGEQQKTPSSLSSVQAQDQPLPTAAPHPLLLLQQAVHLRPRPPPAHRLWTLFLNSSSPAFPELSALTSESFPLAYTLFSNGPFWSMVVREITLNQCNRGFTFGVLERFGNLVNSLQKVPHLTKLCHALCPRIPGLKVHTPNPGNGRPKLMQVAGITGSGKMAVPGGQWRQKRPGSLSPHI